MASITKDKKSGSWRVQFVDLEQNRRSVRLGKCLKRDAEQAKTYIERLLAAKQLGHAPDNQTAEWLNSVGDTIRERLAKVGLAEQRNTATLAEHTRQYIDGRTDLKESTKKQLEHTRDDLLMFFGDDRRLGSITHADAKDWAQWLSVERGLGDNTKGRRVGRARQFFNRAIDQKILTENPFRGINSAVNANEARFHFVSRLDYEKVLDACPDAEWRAIVALSRIGGLRCPSEVLSLRWEHVLWDKERLIVPVPKLEHMAEKSERITPLFPELREILEDLFDQAEPGTEFVINRYRSGEQNLRTTFRKIILRAGLEPWGKPFQNMRASRSTELEDQYPTHVAAKWLGHSPNIARKHYHMVHDEHFERAVRESPKSPEKSSTKSSTILARSAAPHTSAPARTRKQKTPQAFDASGVMRNRARTFDLAQIPYKCRREDSGESRNMLGNNVLEDGAYSAGHKTGHIGDDSGVPADDLAVVVNAWPMLDEIDRGRILAVVREASERATIGA